MFNVSSVIYKDVKNGSVKPEDLYLTKTSSSKGHLWEIKTKAEIQANPSTHVEAQGADLVELLRKAANDQQLPPHFAELANDQKFRVFSKIAPGLETPAHRAQVKEGMKEKISHVKYALRVMGKGTAEFKKNNQPWRLLDSNYALNEIVNSYITLSSNEVQNLKNLWMESKSTDSFHTWFKGLERDWTAAQTQEPLPVWAARHCYGEREKKAWQTHHPGEALTEAKLESWRKTQKHSNPMIPEAEWVMKERWADEMKHAKEHNKPTILYEQWITDQIEGRINFWSEQPKKTRGIINYHALDRDTYIKLDSMIYRYELTGSPLTHDVWIAKELWKETNPPDKSDQAFLKHLDALKYRYLQQTAIRDQIAIHQQRIDSLNREYAAIPATSKGRTKRAALANRIHAESEEIKKLEKKLKNPSLEGFEKWRAEQAETLNKRWRASQTTLPFEEWKKQQIVDPINPLPFVRLTTRQRAAYRNDCVNGQLMRNGNASPTTLEHTEHSGTGWVIFVIGPKNDLYCASHLPGVFHHSSFLADSAVMAGGELKTDANGVITHISSKSGHYKPTHKENREMLRWFQQRGVDLNKITFTCFLEEGKLSQPINAQIYLNGRLPRAA